MDNNIKNKLMAGFIDKDVVEHVSGIELLPYQEAILRRYVKNDRRNKKFYFWVKEVLLCLKGKELFNIEKIYEILKSLFKKQILSYYYLKIVCLFFLVIKVI